MSRESSAIKIGNIAFMFKKKNQAETFICLIPTSYRTLHFLGKKKSSKAFPSIETWNIAFKRLEATD